MIKTCEKVARMEACTMLLYERFLHWKRTECPYDLSVYADEVVSSFNVLLTSMDTLGWFSQDADKEDFHHRLHELLTFAREEAE